LTRLKERLATPLLIRTTRKLTLTAARRAYHDELRILASTLLAREDLAALRLHTELFVRSQAFSFSRAFLHPGPVRRS
jgi:DNA-binding transcriptional LysR family regulator